MMKRLLSLCCALSFFGALPARAAGGFNLTWGAGCWAENPVSLLTWACDTNAAPGIPFVGSFAFQTIAAASAFQSMEVVLDGQVDAASVPDWWQVFNAGSCRQNGISPSSDFTAAAGGCVDPWYGQGQGGIGAWQTETYPPPYPQNTPAPNRVRLKLAYVLVNPESLEVGPEYYGFRIYGPPLEDHRRRRVRRLLDAAHPGHEPHERRWRGLRADRRALLCRWRTAASSGREAGSSATGSRSATAPGAR